MQPTTKNATGAKQIPLCMAIAVYIITMVALLPLYAIADESESMLPNFCGIAYLGVLILIGRTRFGKRWDILIRLSTKRIFH